MKRLLIIPLLCFHACTNDASVEQANQSQHVDMPTNKVLIPPAVQSNLGITFATVERRIVTDSLRVPGKFEYLPSAKREYRTMLSGRIDLKVTQFDHVEMGQLLFLIDSPDWRDIQKSLSHIAADITKLETKLLTHVSIQRAHIQYKMNLIEQMRVWENRVQKLETIIEAGGGSIRELTSAKASLIEVQAEYARAQEKTAEHEAEHAETDASLNAALSTMNIALESAKAMLDIAPESENWWEDVSFIEVRAKQKGVIESVDLTNGGWTDAQTTVMTTVQPEKLRFHALGLQSDLGVLSDGLSAIIVPPAPTASDERIPLQDTMTGTLHIGLGGDSASRTVNLFVKPEHLASWAKAGVAAQLEITLQSTSTPELAIPLSAVQQDGLTPIIFVRDMNNPDEATRMEADLGIDDGRWVEILSGVTDGDEVVLDGGFQLLLATSGSIPKGGHFHADGTYHEGEH
ncbi:MAG: hypothetical protein VX615_05580 [Planctomycetota bacterium]|nr:hypothetical protein [Planctomycetota bacterium]